MVLFEGKVAGALSWPLISIKCQGLRMRGPVPFLLLYAFRVWIIHIASDRHVIAAEVVL